MYTGFTKGLIISLASLAGLALGVYGAMKFSSITAQYLSAEFEINIPILSFALTFIIILFATYLLGKVLEKVVDILSLGFLNKIGGMLFSALKMGLILAVIFVLINQVNDKFDLFDKSKLSSAYAYPYLKIMQNYLLPFVKQF